MRLLLASSSALAPIVVCPHVYYCNPEVGKRWAMSFRSLDYLVVFYYQAIPTKKGPFTPFGSIVVDSAFAATPIV